jgi:hypothetical protein
MVLLPTLMVCALVLLKVIVPVADHSVALTKLMLPLTARVPVLVNVTVPADTVMLLHSSAPVSVTV